jgi:hypothetical protein
VDGKGYFGEGNTRMKCHAFFMDLLSNVLWVSPNHIKQLLAEGEGFEPPDLSINGFQDRRLKPLGHPSG